MFLYLYCENKYKCSINESEQESRFLFRERLIRKALQDYCTRQGLNVPEEVLADTVIERSNKGKPYFERFSSSEGEGVPAVHFSVSHSGTWWGCLMGGEPVGFDMEVCRENINYERIAARFFTEDECDLVLLAGLEVFFDLWVRKEAYVKYTGAGLAEGLNRFSVVADGDFAEWVITGQGRALKQPPCSIRPCIFTAGVKAAYCSASGAPIKAVVNLEIEMLK